MKSIVLGSGAWGTAIGMILAGNGHETQLWNRDAEKAAKIEKKHANPRLTGVKLPHNLGCTADLSLLTEAELVVFAVPSYAVRATAKAAAQFLRPGTVLVSAAKGIERVSGLRMSQVIAEETGGNCPVAVLSGPSHAEEAARGLSTGCIAASEDTAAAECLRSAMMNAFFRVYTGSDTVGVELCGAVKNVVALGCGISDGLGLGDNARALLMTRALSETADLVAAAGGESQTCSGLAGVGDLIVTCTSVHSRNRRCGLLLGQGVPVAKALENVGAVVEGYYAAESVCELAGRLSVTMPICESLHEILYESASPRDCMRRLMTRRPRNEF